MRSLVVRLVLAFGLMQTLGLMAPPGSLVQASGTVTNCSDDSQFSTLLAGGGDVDFNCGTVSIKLSSTQIIKADTTIDGGARIALSGQNARRLFVVSPGVSLTLRNIVLENGSSTGNGGAIFNGDVGGDGGTLILENSTIRNSLAGFSGGAIVSTGPLTITNSRLEGNRALNGGALYPRYAGAVTTIVNSVLRDNHATDTTTNGWGGAILAWDGAPVTIENSEISNNSALSGGGLFNLSGTATLTNVTISGNMALSTSGGGGGGGLFNSFGTAILTNGTISGNRATNAGGGLFYNQGTATLTNVTISGNSATSGGGICNSIATATLTNVTLSGNSATDGGGIYHYGLAASSLVLKNSIVANSPTGGNCFKEPTGATSISSNGFNLSSDTSCVPFLNQVSDRNNQAPLLGPLANNGGPTLTHLPQAGSLAIDNGSGCPATDQRGAKRPVGPACDIGAVEYGALLPLLYLPLISK